MTKALKGGLIAALAVIVGLGLTLSQLLLRFDLALNPVASSIRLNSVSWGMMTDLVPSPFALGAPRDAIVRKLTLAGFQRTADDSVWGRYKNEIQDGYELFQREGDDQICKIQFYAFVKFSEDGRLTSAKGTWHEHGCP